MCRRAVRLLQHRCDCHAAKNCKPTAEAKWHIICYIIEYRMWFGVPKLKTAFSFASALTFHYICNRNGWFSRDRR